MKLLGSKLCILNTLNLWTFDVALPLCYDVGDYPVLVTTGQVGDSHFVWQSTLAFKDNQQSMWVHEHSTT